VNRLDGIAALITGASSGIGRGLARVFLGEGARVFLTARGEERLRAAAAELEAAHPGRTGFAASDVGDPESAAAMARAALARFPDLSVLVNNASILGVRAPIIEQDPKVWEDTLRINTASLLYVTKPLLPAFLARDAASIINVSSTVGRIGKPNWGPYAVSKFGLEGFTQTLAAELHDTGVRVNSVNPGATRTPMRAAAYPAEDPLTLPTPEDIAEVFIHLASPESAGVTGQALNARDYLRT
jgi:NAD(P)-dependent dehydrogenase (short-subunit alcohol dehydrogenase family)